MIQILLIIVGALAASFFIIGIALPPDYIRQALTDVNGKSPLLMFPLVWASHLYRWTIQAPSKVLKWAFPRQKPGDMEPLPKDVFDEKTGSYKFHFRMDPEQYKALKAATAQGKAYAVMQDDSVVDLSTGKPVPKYDPGVYTADQAMQAAAIPEEERVSRIKVKYGEPLDGIEIDQDHVNDARDYLCGPPVFGLSELDKQGVREMVSESLKNSIVKDTIRDWGFKWRKLRVKGSRSVPQVNPLGSTAARKLVHHFVKVGPGLGSVQARVGITRLISWKGAPNA